ncbi:hypothetical protein ACH492_32950 [Streptomyces sp. NPDC019443]|uniref:hypothetical protein n=1 Tax=Streptomyces sp. NPDC019443 TaxID=3365061 RepID=UPI00379AB6AB
MGIGRRARTPSLLETPYLVREWDLPSPLVLLTGADTAGLPSTTAPVAPGGPSVTWFDADLGTELALAADFPAFLQGLTAAGDFT